MSLIEKIRIGYFADGPWSHQAFEKIISDTSIEVAFIVPRTDSADNTLLKYSKKHNIPYHKGVKVNSDTFYNLICDYDCDLFVSMSFNQIFRERIINHPQQKTINCHAGKLPFYRGRNILNWALINDEKEFGITVHYVDEGIDTGDIILQRTFLINDNDNYKTLLEVAYFECANILYDSIKIIQNSKVIRIVQEEIHPVGFYCGARTSGDELLDWNQTSREIFNFVRAICEPGPMARCFNNGKELKINSVKYFENAPTYKGIVGQVLSKTLNGFLIKTKDSFVEIVEFEGAVKVGDRL